MTDLYNATRALTFWDRWDTRRFMFLDSQKYFDHLAQTSAPYWGSLQWRPPPPTGTPPDDLAALRVGVEAALERVLEMDLSGADGGPSPGGSQLHDNALSAGSPSRPAHADGVEGGCWLWWQGTRFDIPKGNVYKMLAFMWGRDSAGYDDLEREVFEDPVEPQTIRSLASKVNNALKKVGIPWRLTTDSTTRQLTKKPSQNRRT
jgi:hypothetical protein